MGQRRSIMQRYRQLGLWARIGIWGSIASIVSLALYFLVPQSPGASQRVSVVGSPAATIIQSAHDTVVNMTPSNSSVNDSSVPSPEAAKADVRLIVGRRSDPYYWLYNPSGQVARDPKYQFNLFDLDVVDEHQGRMNLEIPVQVLRDYILPSRGLGPTRILDLSPRKSEVKPGHVIFGYVTVQCSNCVAPRHFWLFLRIGESGWISEVVDSTEINPAFGRVLRAGDGAIAMVDAVIPVVGREPVP